MVKIVLVEDEYGTREGMADLLEKLDPAYSVVAKAENGSEGVCAVRDFHPDMVITDIRMPHMDGLQMAGIIRDMGIDCNIVILTGYADFKYAQQGIRLGISDYILKPVTISCVRKLMAKFTSPINPEETDVLCTQKDLPYTKVVADMVRVINASYGQRLGLDIFTDKYRLTPEYISSLFTKETGISFSQYLKNVRIEHAKHLILHSDLKIYEIACMVGYPDQKYFSKVFRECTGMSAKQYAGGCSL